MSRIVSDRARTGVHSINHFALNLPDLAGAEKFISAFGLRVERRDEELFVRAAASDHVWARILLAAKKSLAYLSLGCYQHDIDALREQVFSAGGALCDPHPRADAEGFWFRDMDGNLVQVKVAPKTQPDAKSPLPDLNVPSGERGAGPRSKAATVRPTRLSHVLLFTPDVSGAVEFYRRSVGLNLSDRSGNIVAFMHARHGCDHHLVAFVTSKSRGFHHSSWDVPGLEEVGLGSAQMRKAGYGDHWGVGHHVLGSNYFDYVRDPWCTWWEFSSHIDYIPAGMEWDTGDYAPEDALYLWGPDLPASFTVNTENELRSGNE